jgi:hypothetical protein
VISIPEESEPSDVKASTFLTPLQEILGSRIPDESEPSDVKASTFLAPPQEILASRKPIPLPLLDTSDATLFDAPVATPGDEAQTVTSQLCFRDAEEAGSLSPGKYYHVHYKWWPYFILPDPYFLYVTLFPTIRDFPSKTWFQKIVAILAIPAVFCLTITLPVVDNESPEPDGEIKLPSGPCSPNTVHHSHPEAELVRAKSANDDMSLVPRVWNRWITGVQCICAPLFITFIFFRTFFIL